MPEPPSVNEMADQARFLAAMLIHETLSSGKIDWTALYCAIAPACGVWGGESGAGKLDRSRIVGWYRSACAVRQELKATGSQLDSVEKWRKVELEADRIRMHSGGQFLRVGNVIPAEKPRSSAEALLQLATAARSTPITPIMVTQQWDEHLGPLHDVQFDAPGQGTGT